MNKPFKYDPAKKISGKPYDQIDAEEIVFILETGEEMRVSCDGVSVKIRKGVDQIMILPEVQNVIRVL